MTEKFRPSFLNPDIKVGPLADDKYGGGDFTEVGNLENLPESVKEKVPQGYVIKQYPMPAVSIASHMFLEISKEYKEEFSVGEVAKELKHRNLIMKNYFAKSLPELVVPTQIIIGEDEKTNEKRIYEIQLRLDEPNSTSIVENPSFGHIFKYYAWGSEPYKSKAEELVDSFIIAYIKETFPEKINLFKHQVAVFIEEINNLPVMEKYFPYDCALLTNLIFTEHGLRLIDTNAVMPIPSGQSVDWKEEYDASWRWEMFKGSLKLLELIESKLK